MGSNNITLSDQSGLNDTHNSENETNYDRDEIFEYVTEGVLLTSISILGFVGNNLAMFLSIMSCIINELLMVSC